MALLWVFLSSVAGAWILQNWGRGTAQKLAVLQQSGGRVSGQWFVGEFALVVGALLLIVPGLITDAVGICLLIAPVRRGIGALLGLHELPAKSTTIIEGEWTVEKRCEEIEK